MNMFKPTQAKTVKDYLAAVPEGRRKDVQFLHQFIQKNAPPLKPHFAYNMLGYGQFPYKNSKNELLMWPVISLANQKNYMSIYVCCVHNGKYIAESHKKELGKVSVGRSCIRLKKVEDVNLNTLKKVIKEAAKHPGLAGYSSKK